MQEQSQKCSDQDKEINKLLIRIERMETANRIYKWIVGGVVAGAFTLSVMAMDKSVAFADGYSQLKKEAAINSRIIQDNAKEIRKSERELLALNGEVGIVKNDTGHIKTKVDEIHSLIKILIKRAKG